MAMVQVGVIALRSPSGDFLPAQPIYRDIPEQEASEDYIPLDELAEIFAEKFKAYKQAEKSARKGAKNAT